MVRIVQFAAKLTPCPSRPAPSSPANIEIYQRNWIIEGIQSAKREETRKRRARRAAEWLMEVMEAERDLPPAFKIAFARSPKARRAWEARDPHYRRATLLQIFSRPGPVSAAKAVPALIEELELSADSFSGIRSRPSRAQ